MVATRAYVPVGVKAPAFRLPDQQGKTHSLSDYRRQWLVLYFYPKDDTSGCTKQACQFRDVWAKLEQRGIKVLGVSPDDTASHEKFARKYDLPFPLLADPEKQTLEAFGVWQEKSMYGRKYMGVARTTYLISPDGKVAHVWEKVKVPDHEVAVLETVDGLMKS